MEPTKEVSIDNLDSIADNRKRDEEHESAEDRQPCKKAKTSETTSSESDAEDELLNESNTLNESNACSTMKRSFRDSPMKNDVLDNVDVEVSTTCSASIARERQRRSHTHSIEESMAEMAETASSFLEHMKECAARREALALRKLATLEAMQATLESALPEFIKKFNAPTQ